MALGPRAGQTTLHRAVVNIVCIKTGKFYGPEYVNKLYAMIRRNTKRDFRFICFTDNREGIGSEVECWPPPYQMKGWWVKIPLFAPPDCIADDQIIAIDLDVVITGNIDWLLDWRGDFCGLGKWLTMKKMEAPKYYNGSLWSLRPGYATQVWYDFAERGDEIMKTHYSDQEYISEQLPDAPVFNELFPDKIKGFNTHFWNLPPEERPDPNKTPLWIFHGFPKPLEVCKTVDFVKEHWR